MQKHFQQLEKTFNAIASHPSAVSTSLYHSDLYYKKTLNSHPEFFAFIRINSKGIVANEVYRDLPLSKSNFRTVEEQAFFQHVKKTRLTYRSFLSQKNGTLYLIWANPIILPRTHTPDKFGGVVLGKVDLRKALKRMTSNSIKPFLIQHAGIPIYNHKWNNHPKTKKQSLHIPGMPKAKLFTATAPTHMPKNGLPPTFHPGMGNAEISPNNPPTAKNYDDLKRVQNLQTLPPFLASIHLLWLLIPIAGIIAIVILRHRKKKSSS